MPLTVIIPDTIVDKCKQIAPDKTNIESFVIEAVSNYVDELKERKDDPISKISSPTEKTTRRIKTALKISPQTMTNIFIDTSAFYASFDPEDNNYPGATNFFKEIKENSSYHLFMTNLVIYETVTLI